MPNDLPSYYQAARFLSKAAAGTIYTTLQALVFAKQNDCDLSVFRLKIQERWHVVVLGEPPGATIQVRIEALLTEGTIVTLQPEILRFLQTRRAQATQLGAWVEGHYPTTEE